MDEQQSGTREAATPGRDDPDKAIALDEAATTLSPATIKAFDFALESTKQMIALSTGVLAITITFLKECNWGCGES